MFSSNSRPKWWQLYLLFPLLIALFAMDGRLKISMRGHQVVQIGIILLLYGLIHLWLKVNSSALSKMDRAQYSGTVRVIRIPPSDLPALGRQDRSRPKLPDSEIKGLLSNTFEMDYIDAEFLPMEEASQELDKE